MTIEAKLSASKSGLPKTATKVHGRKIVRAYKIPALPTKPNVRCQSPEMCLGYLREIGSSEPQAQRSMRIGTCWLSMMVPMHKLCIPQMKCNMCPFTVCRGDEYDAWLVDTYLSWAQWNRPEAISLALFQIASAPQSQFKKLVERFRQQVAKPPEGNSDAANRAVRWSIKYFERELHLLEEYRANNLEGLARKKTKKRVRKKRKISKSLVRKTSKEIG